MTHVLKHRSSQYLTVTLPNDSELDLELPVKLDDWERPDFKVHVLKDKIVIGYLAADTGGFTENPFDDGDCMGRIVHHPRHRHAGRKDGNAYYDALGLDRDGNPIIDEDKVQMMWRDKVLALPDEVFTPVMPEDEVELDPAHFAQDCRLQLANEEAGDYTLCCMIRAAFCTNTKTGDWELSEEKREQLETLIEPLLTWNWEEVQQQCAEPGNPHAVMLDIYEHSGIAYSISGAGMQCRFDTSRGAALWIPEGYALDEVKRLGKVFDHAYIEKTSFCRGQNLRYNLLVDEKAVARSDNWYKIWLIAHDIARLRIKAGVPAFYDGERKAALELAHTACEVYTDWCNGNCYDVVTAIYDFNGELLEEGNCGGFIGDEDAEDSLEEQIAYLVKAHSK